jgi:ABC-type phosphate transport system substrate-binding protein
VRTFWTFLTSTGLVTLVVITLAACGGGSVRKCEEALTSAATSVEGVVGAEFTCKRSFGNPSQTGSVTIAGSTEAEVAAVMEEVLQAFAASPDLSDASVVYVDFANEDGSITVIEKLAGFNGTPSIRDIREHYGITPG